MIATLAVFAAAALPLSQTTIHLDAGHNGGNASHPSQINRLVNAGGGVRKACDTTGAQTNDGRLTEPRFTLDVALRTERILRARGARVVMTRRSNGGVGPCITQRAAIGNRAHADLALSIHADGGPAGGRGFHVIAPARGAATDKAIVAPSLRLAKLMRSKLSSAGVRRANYIAGGDGLDVRGDLGGLNLSRVPKVFTEQGNTRNATDARLLESPAYRQKLARALANGLTAAAR